MELQVNGETRLIDDDWQEDSLLFVLREHLGLVGPKFGCGVGLCGACTVIVDGQPERSCITSPQDVVGATITTIEGLANEAGELHPVQKAWLEASVPQCGFCQAGQIMSAVALLNRTPTPTDADIDDALSDNLCRCGTYQRIRDAIKMASGTDQ